MQLWQKKIAKKYYYTTQRGITSKTQVYQNHCDPDLYPSALSFQTRSNTAILFVVKSVADMATDLTINYAKFVPLNVWIFAPYMSSLCYANFDP